MKQRWTFPVLRVAGILLLILLPAVPAAGDTGVEPPETSYSDEWADLEGSATPFLDLRNESPADTVPEPEAPDTPTVETVNVDGETVPVPDSTTGDDTGTDRRSSDTQTTDTTGADPGEDTGVRDVVKADTTSSDTVAEAPSSEPETDTEATTDEERPEESTEESPDTSRSQPEDVAEAEEASGVDIRDESEPEAVDRSAESNRTRKRRGPSGRTTGSFFDQSEPREPGAVAYNPSMIDSGVPSGTVATGSIRSLFRSLPAEEYPRTPDPFWWRYYWWITGGLVVTVTIGMFFWFRRRRVEVVDTSYPSADSFFQEQLKRKRKPVTAESKSPSPNRDFEPVQPSGENGIASTARPEPQPRVDYGRLAERLREEGYDGEFERMLKLYYEDGMNEQQIAERFSRGVGAVGLVLDYADRLRKDLDHGKRA